MAVRWNPPPGWPTPPPGWTPPAGWQPPTDAPPAPPGWVFWEEDAEPSAVHVPPPPDVYAPHGPTENVLASTRMSWTAAFTPTFTIGAATTLVGAALAVTRGAAPSAASISFAASVLLIVGLLNYARWYTSLLTITDTHITVRQGTHSEQHETLALQDVTNVHVVTPFLGSLFGYSTIEIVDETGTDAGRPRNS